ncbi:MAG: hypothetical protein ABI968_03155 [Acidobacteriota bacterium]
MKISKRLWPWLILVLGLPALTAAPARAEKVRNHFDSDSVMRTPGFFDAVVLGVPGKAKWLILTDLNPPSAPNRLVQVEQSRPADSIAAALRRNYSFQDGSVSTFVKQGSGREGLILRMKDEKNFLVLFVDASGEVVLSSYVDGKAQELGRGKMPLQRPWERYAVTAAGPTLSVFFNDQKLFDAKDPHPVAGRTGLAATGPGEASFDEFIIEPAETPAQP